MMKWPVLLLALCVGVAASLEAASGTEVGGPPARVPTEALQSQIMRCFSPPPGASTAATLAVALAADGTLSGEPKVVAQGTTPVDQAFAKAAARAITRCAPYRGAGGQTVTITFAAPAANPGVPSDRPTKVDALAMSLGGETLTLPWPDGLCAVRADGSPAQSALWRRFTPAQDRGADLLALAMDCPTLANHEAGGRARPREVITLLSGVAQAEPPPLDAYLDTLAQRFGQREPLTERFWQSPRVSGAPLLGRDAHAVYVAQRQLGKADGIAVAGVSAYTRLGRVPLIVNFLAMDGSDISPQARTTVAAIVARLHARPGAP